MTTPVLFDLPDPFSAAEFTRRRKRWQGLALSHLLAFADADRDLARKLCLGVVELARHDAQLYDLVSGHLRKPLPDGSARPSPWPYAKHVQMVTRYHMLKRGLLGKPPLSSPDDIYTELQEFFEYGSMAAARKAYFLSRTKLLKAEFRGVPDFVRGWVLGEG